jgi:hypothetical protein
LIIEQGSGSWALALDWIVFSLGKAVRKEGSKKGSNISSRTSPWGWGTQQNQLKAACSKTSTCCPLLSTQIAEYQGSFKSDGVYATLTEQP